MSYDHEDIGISTISEDNAMGHSTHVTGVRTFDTGATRDTDQGKPDYEGFLSPAVMRKFGEYMVKHQRQSDGNLRASDNWQKGIPRDQYIKSMFRHFVDLWTLHRGHPVKDTKGQDVSFDDALSALLFNTQGYYHEYLKAIAPKTFQHPNGEELPLVIDREPFPREPGEGSSKLHPSTHLSLIASAGQEDDAEQLLVALEALGEMPVAATLNEDLRLARVHGGISSIQILQDPESKTPVGRIVHYKSGWYRVGTANPVRS